jgi:hypothetical protein
MSRVTEFLFCFCRLSSALNELYYDIAKTKKCDEVPKSQIIEKQIFAFLRQFCAKTMRKKLLAAFQSLFFGTQKPQAAFKHFFERADVASAEPRKPKMMICWFQ